MNKQRDTFLTKDYVINRNVIKYIKNLDITLKDFLLIMYFINVSPVLNNDDIKENIGFNDDEIIECFSSLVDKGFLTLDVKDENGKMVETVILDSFYDKLYLSMSTSYEVSSDLYGTFEENLGRTLNAFEYETINGWINDGFDEETIIKALKESVLHGVYSFKYIDKVLHNWKEEDSKDCLDELKDEDSLESLLSDFDWMNND